ncbi:MAG: restriction endonuclease subunit S [Bacteroidales bacterium]|nr:restriction endonuclease subunit S [Bacteroidales bacterium]
MLEKGYEPKHIVFEPAFKVGHINKPSYGDILIFDKEYNPLVLIENKTYGQEFSREWNNMQKDGGQLFSYLGPLVNQLGLCNNLVLFAADFENNEILKSHIITLKDNDKRLADLDNPKTFRDAQGKYYDVWNETYGKSFETKGLFEKDIAAYSIGKLKYTIADLKGLSHAEIRPIYHEFATILRNHAITDFEHSFYILIDLFLCKITDERNNPNDLQFYYKGVTRDTPKEYCSRLLKLYQQGKKEIFNIEVVNKDEDDIKQIFDDTNRSLTNGLFKGIKELFEEVKFYNIKKFNFIDVENKEEFELNFQIIIKIAALIQDINLSNSETNHFFGDLFEGLLSKNVHQTEGQFFTPLPIVAFIIKSLPTFPNSDKIKVLDYACGAGHFLTEFIKKYPNAKVYGIEKSQSLSQVAKIATIINGGKDSHIVFKDSLSCINTSEVRFQGFDTDSFDCLIANPPYSVSGFLSNLSENEKKQYELTKCVDEKIVATNNKIECFFLERAKQFLRTNGLLGIILPSSILTNGKIYTKTRELLFAHFNLLGIVYLNSRTFGSTGTNTIILFAQRVKKNSEGLLHTFIDKKDYKQYLSWEFIDKYIQKQGYDEYDYFAFMQDDELNETLEKNSIFVDYKKHFKTKPIKRSLQIEWFESSNLYKSAGKVATAKYRELFCDFLQSSIYKRLEDEEFRRQFIAFAKEIECDKLNTFIQIGSNKIVILQSPPDKINNKSNKDEVIKFLGYDWSNRKGDEGIKYVTSRLVSENEEQDDTDDKDKEIVNAINSINFIDTPLYNPNNDLDSTKFAFAIRKHINKQCKKFSFSENNKIEDDFYGEMSELLSYINLSDMIDFSRAEFDKSIKPTSNKKIDIKSKYPLVKLGDIAEIIKGKSITSAQTKQGNIKVVAGGTDYAYLHNEANRPANTITISASGANAGFVNFWREPIFASDCTTVRGKNDLQTLFLYNFLQSIQNQIYYLQKGSAQPHVYPDDLKMIQVPVITSELQNQIVSECEKVDEEYKISQTTIETHNKQIVEHLNGVHGKIMSIGEIGKICMCKRIMKDETNTTSGIPFFKIGTFGGTPDAYISKEQFDKYKSTYSYPKKGQILISAAGTLGKSIIFDGKPSYFQDSNIVWIDNDESQILNLYLHKILQVVDWNKYKTEGSVIPRIYNDKLRSVTIPVPSLAEQQRIVSQIEQYEAQIAEAKAIMSGCADRKKKILEKYLN